MKQAITIGELIFKLKNCPQSNFVCLDFDSFSIRDPHSYRGHYEDIAFCYTHQMTWIKVNDLLNILENEVLNKTFTGWKGGDFVMNSNKLVWIVEREGECNSTAIVDVYNSEDFTILETGYYVKPLTANDFIKIISQIK